MRLYSLAALSVMLVSSARAAGSQAAFHDPTEVGAGAGFRGSAHEHPAGRSFSVPLWGHENNRATSSPSRPREGQGMHNGSTYPAEFLPTGRWVHEGIEFVLPDWEAATGGDNIRADGQLIALSEPREISSVHLLAAGEGSGGFNLGNSHEELGVVFDDGSVETLGFLVKTWWAHHWTNKAPIRTSFQRNETGVPVYNASHIFHTVIPVPAAMQDRRVAGFILPGEHKHNTMHLFALSCEVTLPGTLMSERAVVSFAKATRRWENLIEGEGSAHYDDGKQRAQVVQVTVRNSLPASRHLDRSSWIDRPLTVTLKGSTFETIRPATIPRLMPGDSVRVDILVAPTGESAKFIDARAVFAVGAVGWAEDVDIEGADLVHDFSTWTQTDSDIEQHSAPGWYDKAKFGIFIHWGLFSVPAFSPTPLYAEWLLFWLHAPEHGDATYEYILNTYGPDFVYDDLIGMFQAEKFNASEWMKLISDAGAKYFVFTTKHHDGYALFDTKETSHRNSLLLGPKRDFLRELMDAAKEEQPHLHRGTYFSMPEWFNPLYKPHARVSFPGGPAENPFKPGELEPYTGHVDVGDYVDGLQLPQMRILAEEYDSEMLWCDIGLDNSSALFASEWFAQAAREGREVAISNRCGIGGDFDTPEMEKFDSVEMNKWETCASMDPFSFGYSAGTKDDEYRNATNVIHTLIDITAHGGNFLLNVGPKADGSIIEAISAPLREAGRWLKLNGRAIYDTVPFPLLPEVHDEAAGVHVAITRTPEAFHIISLKDMAQEFKLDAALPILPCDVVTFVTEAGDITIPWTYEDGVLAVDLTEVPEADYMGRIAYVLEVRYAQCEK